MPVIAVGVAIAVDVAAGAAFAAGTLTALGAIAAVGATVAAVGAITKNKALSLAGTVLGVVGAVGSLASAAGLLGDVGSAPLFGPSPTGAAADAASADTIDTFSGQATDLLNADVTPGTPVPPIPPEGGAPLASATENAADPSVSLAGSSDAIPSTEMAPQDAAALRASTQTAPGAGGAGGDTSNAGLVMGQNPIAPPSGAETAANTPPPLPPGGLAANAPGQTALPGAVQPGNAAWGDGPVTAAGNTLGTDTSGSGISGILSGISSFTKDNPLLSYGILQSAGSFLSGSTSTLTPAQVSALDAQAAANNAATAMQNQQRANLAMPKSVASSSPVTGTPQQLVPSPGFINQAPRQPAITGAPA